MIVTWANAALISAAVLAVVNILDSHLVTRRFPSLPTFFLPVGIVHITYALSGAFAFGLPAGVKPEVLAAAIVSSVIRTGAILILLDSLRHREVSRVVPVVYTYPMFVAVMASFFLGERLAPVQWMAVAVVAFGAVLVSWHGGQPHLEQMERPRSVLLLFASVLFAAADVTGKFALSQLNNWQLFWIGAAVMGTTFLCFGVRRSVVHTILALPSIGRSLAILAANEVVAGAGIVISYWALERGPVSLVSALLSSRPLFVLLFALILSRSAPGFLLWGEGRKAFGIRMAATVMIVAGVAVIETYG